MNKFRQTLFWNNYKEFDKVVNNSSMRCTVDAVIYWKLFKEYNFSNILEVGVYQGLTTGLMLESSNNIKSYTGIDPVLKLDLFNKIWQDYLSSTKFHSMYSNDFVPSATYDFILIDGGHGYSQALSDLMMAATVLEPHGVLAIDDYILPEVAKAIEEFKKHTALVPFLQAEQTEFWHYPSVNRSVFLDNLLQDSINNFIFMYNINDGQILKAKTLNVFTNELDFFNQVIEFYDI
jgi:predicted O-methyltransferase YrrM